MTGVHSTAPAQSSPTPLLPPGTKIRLDAFLDEAGRQEAPAREQFGARARACLKAPVGLPLSNNVPQFGLT